MEKDYPKNILYERGEDIDDHNYKFIIYGYE